MADSSRQQLEQRIRCGKAKNQVKLSRQGCRRTLQLYTVVVATGTVSIVLLQLYSRTYETQLPVP
eukprot:COSAG01_NODE_2081_length_8467_cov_15.325645_5_plen_65_part_00